MRVELEVDLRPTRPEAAAVETPEAKAEKRRRDREDIWLRRIALARVIEAGIVSGEFTDLADAARRCGVSRARVSQVVDVRQRTIPSH